MTLLEEFIALLDLLDLDVGPRFSAKMPSSPDRCVVLARYGGDESLLADNYDEPRIQLRTRGPATDARIAEADAELLYDHLNGLGTMTLPGGTWLQLAVGLNGGPVYIGQDANNRAEYTVNLRCDVSRTATNRSNP
jgi:hypothetical protein